jgi:hypothetical protein
MRRDMKDVLAGFVFVAFGLAFALLASSYEIGSTLRMGPGYFPFVLGGLLAVLGGVTVFKGVTAAEGDAIGAIPLRALTLILGAVLFFGLTVRGLGLVPSVFLTSVMSVFASRQVSLVRGVVISAGLTVLCVLVFVVALRLRLPLAGPWIPV